jgi:hypothetical protein
VSEPEEVHQKTERDIPEDVKRDAMAAQIDGIPVLALALADRGTVLPDAEIRRESVDILKLMI